MDTGQVSKRQFWSGHVETQQSSGLSHGEYCRLHGLSKSSLGYWRGKLAREGLAGQVSAIGIAAATDNAGRQSEMVAIVPVAWEPAPAVATPRSAPASALRVAVGRYAVHVDGDFVPEVLGKLVRTLEAL